MRVVLRNGSKPQVIDVDARCTAMVFVVNVHPVRDGSVNSLPRVTVCLLLLLVDIYSAISVRFCISAPDKRVALPLRPECKRFFRCLSHHEGNGFRITMF